MARDYYTLKCLYIHMNHFIRHRICRKVNCLIFTACGLAICVGCSALFARPNLGRQFSKPDDSNFIIGKTKIADVFYLMWKVYPSGTTIRDGKPFTHIVYTYYEPTLPAATKTFLQKNLSLWFDGEILIGKEFSSSFALESTDFDIEKAKRIRQDMNRSEVVGIMGEPTGTFGDVLTEYPGDSIIAYTSSTIQDGKSHLKRLVVELSPKGKVTDVSLTNN